MGVRQMTWVMCFNLSCHKVLGSIFFLCVVPKTCSTLRSQTAPPEGSTGVHPKINSKGFSYLANEVGYTMRENTKICGLYR